MRGSKKLLSLMFSPCFNSNNASISKCKKLLMDLKSTRKNYFICRIGTIKLKMKKVHMERSKMEII
ncbi:MAG: hypothetical protein ACLRR3_11910 [Eubacterium sp.]